MDPLKGKTIVDVKYFKSFQDASYKDEDLDYIELYLSDGTKVTIASWMDVHHDFGLCVQS